jgi:hypothetical protein
MAAAVAMAQTGRVEMVGRTEGPLPVVDSTLNVFPQINEGYSQRPVNPSNKSLPGGLPRGLTNSLRAGGIRPSTVAWTEAKFPGIRDNGSAPPDPDIAVGPNHVVQVVNTAIAFFSKTGTRTFQQDLGRFGFFASVGPSDFVFDPKVFYDQVSQRFFVVALDADFVNNNESHILLAVSDDADPNGTWAKYRINALLVVNNIPLWFDYPGFGYNKDGVVISGNMFTFPGSFRGVQFLVLDKAPLLSNGRPTVTSFFEPDSFTAQPAHTMDPTTDRVYAVSAYTTGSLQVYAVNDLASSPSINKTQINVPNFSVNIGLVNSRNGGRLDPVGVRLMNAAFRNRRIVTTHTVAVSDSDSRGMVRWYEIDVRQWPTSGFPVLLQSGNVRGRAGENYSMPAIFSNRFGSMALVFTRSSNDIAADMMVATRKQSDQAGTFGTPTMLAESRGSYSGYARWGDYFAVRTDPTDDATFWANAQLIPQGAQGMFNWTTEIQKFTIRDESGGFENVQPIAVSVRQGTLRSGGLAEIRESDNNNMVVTSSLTPRVGEQSSIEVTFELDRPVGQVSSLSLITEATSTAGNDSTGMVWLFNWNANRFEHLRSFRLNTSGDSQVRVTLSSGFSRFVNAQRRVRAVVRGLIPVRRTDIRSFNLNVDQVQLLAVFTGS